ncbi:MAG: protein kinase [Dehalococcoidia bacterium]
MPSERIQRQIDRMLDQAEGALESSDWAEVRRLASDALRLDPDNEDAQHLFEAAGRDSGAAADESTPLLSPPDEPATPTRSISDQPTSFAGGRYEVRRFLGEGGKKRVFLAHDTRLDRDVAFALIKTEGLDATGRERITREAQAMGRLGAHPHIVTIFEIGEEAGSPYVVNELLVGGDVEGELEAAGGPLPLARTLEVAKGVCRGIAFAHERGIVHRDLKPGNVWLTEDGTAKIGDFGLAVSLDRSRLTQHGMMVGTVAYMPPEQALGGEVTPQADLYSLGAMLYELVTGRPPFQADDPTAIISQHINAPPVAPSWHSEHCPPDLEALILRLLAKVPADRPASASEVLTALEAVDPGARSASHSDSSANPLDRLARGVFVGRERELERLRAAFDEAFAGRGSVVMLVGEPGIGKTRTSLELETYARMRGGRVIWGRAHEAAGAPPYRPWVQAADTYSNAWGLDAIGPQLASEDTAELSRIFRLLREQPNYASPPEIVDPAAAQFRLFEAYTKLLRAFASEAPVVVVLDDLHWADKPTLLLLQHVARELARLRVLIVGTYRDTELSRTHPLSEALAELNREGGFQRVNLVGLEENEVADYIRGAAGIEPSRALVDRLFEETEGNPFFLHEVVNLMTEEGTISSDSVSDIAIPEGVREALGRRLDRLSEEANALLQYAAVAGRQFAYDTLKLVTGHDDDALLRLIEEGLAARVIEETAQPGRYQFTHALMQETLLDELSTTRRVRMHGEVGEAIEQRYGDGAEGQVARLARHFLESAVLTEAHASKASTYSEVAGRQAETQAAWAEAARHYANALANLSDNSEPRRRVELLVSQGRCLANNFDSRPAWRSLMEARALAQQHGLARQVVEASIEAAYIQAPPDRVRAFLMEALEVLPEGDVDLEFRLLAITEAYAARSGWHDLFESSRTRLRELASLPGIDPARVAAWEGLAVTYELVTASNVSEFDGIRRRLEEIIPRLELGGGLTTLLHSIPVSYCREGRLDEAVAAYESSLEVYRRTRYRIQEQNSLIALAGIAILRADYDGAERLLEDMPGENLWREMLRIHMASVRGDEQRAASMLPDPSAAGGVPIHMALVAALRCRLAHESGNDGAARAALAEAVDALRPSTGALWEGRRSLAIAEIDGALASLLDVETAQTWLAELVSGAPARLVAYSARSLDLVRGFLAIRLNRVDEAHAHFRTGLEWCERAGCPVEAGRCHQGLAEVAERRGDHALAMQHLDAAGELFGHHGAKLYLDRVLAKKEILKA